jgi:L,D-transpeptidase YcbB
LKSESLGLAGVPEQAGAFRQLISAPALRVQPQTSIERLHDMRKQLSVFLAIGVGIAACSGGAVPSGGPGQTKAMSSPGEPEPLSEAGQQELRSILSAGKLPELKWPNFSDHAASVRQFYEESDYRLAWSRGAKPTAQALEMIAILEDADKEGLDSKDYDGPRWPDRVKDLQSSNRATESARVKFDVALTVSASRYVSDLHLGRVDPEELHKDFDPERPHHDAGAFLEEEVIAAPSVKDALAKVECPYPGYQRDIVALQKYLQLAKEEVPDPLPQVQKAVGPGQNYDGLQKLVKRLEFLGDLPSSVSLPSGSQNYSGDMVAGVKRFQIRHGMEADGKLGPQTIAELNRPMSDRVQQLRLSLERWRWLPHDFPQPPIVVNIPEFKLRAYEALSSGKPVLMMAVVVGKAMRTQTPVLDEDMKYVVFWPYWNVPPSILRGEMIPKIAKDRTYIEKNGYEVVTYSGQVVTDGAVSDEVLAQLRAGKLMVRQKPGPNNALGLAKFIFPNDANVYLHSTPAQSLFGRARRDFSHGCIRVADPKGLAAWVLRNNPGWTKERIEAAFQAGKEQQVNLTKTIPVLIVYSTAVTEEDGQVFFFPDIYGHDKELAKVEADAYSREN